MKFFNKGDTNEIRVVRDMTPIDVFQLNKSRKKEECNKGNFSNRVINELKNCPSHAVKAKTIVMFKKLIT